MLYRPSRRERRGLVAEKYRRGGSLVVSGVFNYLVQRLENLDRYAARNYDGLRGAVQLKFKWDHLRAQAIGLIRNLEYILQNVASLTPSWRCRDRHQGLHEYFVAATVDWYFENSTCCPS
jgi:hypothetical protein